MKELYTLIAIAALLFVYGCEGKDCLDCGSDPGPESHQSVIESNCALLETAVNEFAAQNSGMYPADVCEDSTETGLTVIDLLPGGQRLVNPFTGQRTEPVDRRAVYPGEIGYEELGYIPSCVGYIISGCGYDSIIVELSNIAELNDSAIANCYTVLRAVKEFASWSCGVYPGNLSDTTPNGDTVIDFLPDGKNLWNPYTLNRGEPVDGTAWFIGQTGYVVVAPGGSNVGYTITGVGHRTNDIICRLTNIDSYEDGIVATNCHMVQFTAGEFASRNNGVYPRDIDTDTNLDGDTLLDCLQHYIRDGGLRNPYTHEQDQPVDRRASNPGETGYEAVLDGGSVVAFIVTGVGAVADSIIVEFDIREMCRY